MGRPLIPVATYMMKILDDFRDEATGDGIPSQLTVESAEHFGILAKDGTPQDWVYGMAIFVVELDKARREGRFSPGIGGWINSLGSDEV